MFPDALCDPPEPSYADLRAAGVRPEADYDPDRIRARHGWPRHVFVRPEAHRLADDVKCLKEGLAP